ncbi:MAG: hypothetical protein AABN95_03405 [Acidobacteriota bacterium]
MIHEITRNNTNEVPRQIRVLTPSLDVGVKPPLGTTAELELAKYSLERTGASASETDIKQ